MQQRKSHTKSRNGCQGCKTRHIKCDEQTPSCANCVTREAECVYVARKPRRSAAAAATTTTSVMMVDKTGRRKPRLPFPGERPHPHTHTHTNSLGPRPPTTSPLAFSCTPCGSPVLELELMHRWSTRTWQILYAVPVCRVSVLQHLTRASLGYTFMTKALLASAALDTAMYGGGAGHPRTYRRAALQLMNEASADYRRQLQGNINQDNLWLLAEFSGLLGMFHFAVPSAAASRDGSPDSAPDDHSQSSLMLLEEDRSVLSRVVHLYDMTAASYELCTISWDWLLDSPSSAAVIMRDYQTDLTLMHNLPADVLAATKLMSEVCRVARLPPTGDPALDAPGGSEGPLAYDVFSYRVAIGHLRYAFAEDRIKAYCLSVASGAHAAGPEFARGLRAREPVAMFVVVFWGVLMHWQARDEMVWWIASSGRDMVREASELLAASHIYDLDDVREGVAWARRQVGLEPMADYEAMLFSDIVGVVDDEDKGLSSSAPVEAWKLGVRS